MIMTGLMLFVAYIALFGILLISGLPPILVFGMGIAMVFFQYFMSDKLVLKTTGAKAVTEEEQPKLHGMIERLSQVGGIPKPRTVAIMDIEAPNAFAVKAVNFFPLIVKRLSCLIERALAKDSAAASLKFAKLKSRVS